MRMTRRKKEILNNYGSDYREWVTTEIGPPPFDASGVICRLHGWDLHQKRHHLESTKRTLKQISERLKTH